MDKYEIDVNLVDAAGSVTGNTFQVSPMQMKVKLPEPGESLKYARVIWTFRNLPAGLKPVITFDSPEVIAAGPTTTLGTMPQVAFEIRFPPKAQADLSTCSVSYTVSAPAGATKALQVPPLDGPNLVVVRSPGPPPSPPPPPSDGAPIHAPSYAKG
jgi:hypothetical protein